MKSILIVDDDADVREMLCQFFTIEGYSVATARNGKEALDKLRSGSSADLILLDLMMPVMDGWQFRLEQQRDPVLAGIPVVVLSAVYNARERAGLLGAVDYMQKPVEFDKLIETAERHRRAS
ncbi:MAG: response regulator [Bacteroidales bacterium]